MRLKTTIAITLGLLSTSTLAAGSGTGHQNVASIEITSSDNLKITLEGESHQSSCSTTGSETQMMVPFGDRNFEHFLSLALAAQASNRKVYMWISNSSCVTEGSKNYARPMTMIIRNY